MKLARAAHSKKVIKAILVRTKKENALISEIMLPNLIELVDSTALSISEKITGLLNEMVTKPVNCHFSQKDELF